MSDSKQSLLTPGQKIHGKMTYTTTQEVDAEFAAVRTEMGAGFAAVRSEMATGFQAQGELIRGLGARVDGLEARWN